MRHLASIYDGELKLHNKISYHAIFSRGNV